MAGCGRLFVPVGSINVLGSRCWFTNSYRSISAKSKKSIEKSLLPPKPKRPLTPFFRYMNLVRPNVINEFPNCKITEIAKKISQKWATEDPNYKLKLHQDYDNDYKEYAKKLLDYEKSITPEQKEQMLAIEDKMHAAIVKTEMKNRLNSLGKPKRAPSAFLLYVIDLVKTKKPDIPTQEFIKSLSIQWKNMSEEDKKRYQLTALELREHYHKKKAEWENKMIKEGHNISMRGLIPKLQSTANNKDK